MPKRNSIKLTIPVVKEFTCQQGKDYDTRWDCEIVGFGVRAYANGTKSFVFSYRQNGVKRVVVLGKFGSITLDQARDQAKKRAAEIVNGGDPAKEKKAKIQKDKRTLTAVSEQYLEEHANKKKKPRSASRDESLLRLHIRPRLGTMPITSITRQDIRRLQNDIGQHSEVTANRALALLSKLFNLSEEWGYRPEGTNPCRFVKKYPEHERERILTDEELARFGEALTAFDAINPAYHTPFANMIRLIMYTGARLGEILNARWDDMDNERKNLLVKESKTGRKTITLSDPCRLILNSINRIDGNPFIITGNGKEGRVGEVYRRWSNLLELAEIEGLRIHDLRHNFATRGAMAGLSLYMIGSALGHSNTATTKRYAHRTETPMQQLANTIGADIAAHISRKPSAKIICMSQN